jgi:dipeptidyl aminopeptidase/acylaminoacyl peptidase
VLFNPAVVLGEAAGLSEINQERVASLKERMGVEPKSLSPYHHVKAGGPPTILFHGKADTTVPYATAELFAKAMTDAGNKCQLVGYEGQLHGFFNYGRGNNEYYEKTVAAMDEFLVDLGYIKK